MNSFDVFAVKDFTVLENKGQTKWKMALCYRNKALRYYQGFEFEGYYSDFN